MESGGRCGGELWIRSRSWPEAASADPVCGELGIDTVDTGVRRSGCAGTVMEPIVSMGDRVCCSAEACACRLGFVFQGAAIELFEWCVLNWRWGEAACLGVAVVAAHGPCRRPLVSVDPAAVGHAR
jgi:hypothetical protein